jgi:ribose transport system permease protein
MNARSNWLSRHADADWFGPAAICIAAMAGIGAFDPNFLAPLNINVLLLAIAINGVIAMSQMIIIAIGQMNLSVGAIGGFAAISFVGLMEVLHMPPLPAAVLALAIGCAAGFFNGWLIATTGISAFIITLAGLSIFKGMNLGITQAQPFYGVPESVKALGNDALFGLMPLLLVPTAVVAVLIWFLLARLPLGRNILAVGANPHAAALSGISVKWTVIAAHTMSGGLAALAGLMAVARLQIGQPTIGDDWLLLSFAAPVIGGAVLAGGHVSVSATVLGVAIVALITQALVLFRIDPFLVQVVLGSLILWAVGMNRWREARAQRKAVKVA